MGVELLPGVDLLSLVKLPEPYGILLFGGLVSEDEGGPLPCPAPPRPAPPCHRRRFILPCFFCFALLCSTSFCPALGSWLS